MASLASTREARRRRPSVAGLALLIALVVAGRLARGQSRAPARPAPTPVAVITAPAHEGDLPVTLSALGTVTALNTVTVRSRADGQLVRVLFREGQTVRAGERLAEIDPRPFEVQLAQAQGQQARDEALLANARVDLDRYRDLVAKDAVPRQQLDTQAALVRQYEAALVSDRAQVASARLSLAYCRITAPLSGRIGLRLVDPGNMVHASDSGGLAVITEVQPIAIVFSVPEDDLPQMLKHLGTRPALVVEAYDREQKNKLAMGSVLTVDNQIDPATGTVRVKALFANADRSLFPNQFVNVRLLVDTVHAAALVPAPAVQRGPDSTFLYVVRPDRTVQRRTVTLSAGDDQQVAVASGLAAGERVVVDGFDRLQDGAGVTEARPASTQ